MTPNAHIKGMHTGDILTLTLKLTLALILTVTLTLTLILTLTQNNSFTIAPAQVNTSRHTVMLTSF